MEYTINRIPKGQKLYEWAGAVIALVGSFLLATHGQYADWGFLFFLVSNVCLIVFAFLGKHYGLLLMQLGFTLTSLLGIAQGFGISL